jgi:hypothetical protein
MQEKLGDILLLKKRTRLSAYLRGTNTGTEQELTKAVNEMGMEWASAPVCGFSQRGTYAADCGFAKSAIVGNVKTGAGRQGHYCDNVNKGDKKTFVKNVVINIIHARWQLAQKLGNPQKPVFEPDFMKFDLANGDTLSGNKQIGIS